MLLTWFKATNYCEYEKASAAEIENQHFSLQLCVAFDCFLSRFAGLTKQYSSWGVFLVA